MLAVYINNTPLDIYPDTQIEFEYSSPAFNLEVQEGSFGFTIKIPATATNMKTMGYPDVIANNASRVDTRYAFRVEFQGIQFCSGIARLSYPITDKFYSIYFIVSGFGLTVKDKKLTDYDWGGAEAKTSGQTATEWNDYVKDVFAGTHADADKFCFPTICNLGIDGVDMTSSYRSNFINYFHQSGDSCVFFYNYYTPAPYLSHILTSIFEREGWALDLGFLKSNVELATLILMTHVVKEIYAIYTPGSGVAPGNTIDDTLDLAKFLPNMTVSELINGIRRTFNCNVLFSSNSRTARVVSWSEILSNNKTVNWSDKIADKKEITEESTINGYTFAFTEDTDDAVLENYLQKMFNRMVSTMDHNVKGWHALHFKGVDDVDAIERQEATDALYDMRFASGSELYYWCYQKGTIVAGQNDSSPWVTISGSTTTPAQLDFLFNLTASDYTAWKPLKAIPRYEINEPVTFPTTANDYGEVAIIPTRYLYYAFYREVTASGWASGTDGFIRMAIVPHYPFVTGDGAMLIESPLRPMPMLETHLFHANTDGSLQKFRVPFCEQSPLMDFERSDDDRVAPKLLFYREADPSLSFAWPYASSDYYKSYTNAAPVGGVTSFEKDLHWEGVYGLYAQYWSDWAAWNTQKKKVIMTAHLTIDDIINFDFDHKVLVEFQEYLIAQLSFTLSNSGLSDTKITAYKR